MAIAEIVIAEDGVVKEALEDDVLITGGAGIVDASQATGLAGRYGCVGRDIRRIIPDGI